MAAVRILPFPSSEGLDLSLANFDDPSEGREITPVDGDMSGDTELAGSYDLVTDPPWKKLTMRITAKLPTSELERVVPEGCDRTRDLVLAVSVACPATKYRQGVALAPGSDGTWSGLLTLVRRDLSGVLILKPSLSLASGTPEPPARPTLDRGTVIARGRPVRLIIDGHARQNISALVVTLWEDFSASDSIWRREHSNSIFHLEPYADRPRLFLNARYSELREILSSEAEKGPEASIRDLTATLIADSVWSQLIVIAASSVTSDESEEGVAISGAGWKQQLVTSCLPALYPDEPSARERLRRLGSDLSEGGAESLVSRIATIVQGMVGAQRVVESAIRTHESVRSASENGE
jgi:hypothetical protein